jgi:glycosyltransferase involved in cell wall biosynthesis
MQDSSPFFSIILPTFNRSHLIERALHSVLAQTFSKFELIIVDDGSRDDTFSLVKPIALADKRLRYHFAQNRGLALARNLGISMSNGQWITFIDSDDEYLPEHLASRARYLREDPTVDLLHGGVEIIGDAFVADKRDPTKRIALAECVIGGTFVIRRALIDRVGAYREVEYGDDAEFFDRVQARGAKIKKVEDPTYRYYRTESDSLCAIAERSGVEGILAFRRGEV